MRQAIKGTAAGVPYVALPPGEDGSGDHAPLVVSWHMVDPPRTEAAMASALPLTGVPAWRVYFGLPKSGTRIPDGGFEEVMRLGSEDFILKLFNPLVRQAAAEAPAAIEAIRGELPIEDGPVGLLGGSMGSAVALLLLAKGDLPVSAAALVSPVSQVAPMADCFGPYTWTEESRNVAEQFDFVARAGEIARRRPQPAVLIVVGERDTQKVGGPAASLRDALAGLYTDSGRVHLVTVPEMGHALAGLYIDSGRVRLVTVPEMGHALAEAPGLEPAPQTRDAERVDLLVTEWFLRYLTG